MSKEAEIQLVVCLNRRARWRIRLWALVLRAALAVVKMAGDRIMALDDNDVDVEVRR